MSDQPDLSLDARQRCHGCGKDRFLLFRDGIIACSSCLVIRAQLDPVLVAAPPGGQAQPRPAPELNPGAWIVTFGLDHPLNGRYVRLRGGEEASRHLASKIFGPGNWAAVYPPHAGKAIIEKHGLRELDLSLA